jgi:hypothetical protein
MWANATKSFLLNRYSAAEGVQCGGWREAMIEASAILERFDWREGGTVNQVIDFAGVAGALAFSVALALGLEWLSLHGLMRLMPRSR